MIDLFRVHMAKEAPEMVAETLRSGYIGQGPKVDEFEQAFGAMVGAPEPPLALNSCTSALELALYLCNVYPCGDVITTPMTCTATNSAILSRDGKIIWADVDPLTGIIDPQDVGRKLWSCSPVAIVAVDWAGHQCDYNAIRKAAPGIPIIQDAAHHPFVDMFNRGDYVCWSFQAIKHLTTGDGGALLAPPEQMERARLLRWYGLDRRSSNDFRCEQNITESGWKFHMNDIAATIGLANLPYLPGIVERHRVNAFNLLSRLQGVDGIRLPYYNARASWWLFTLIVEGDRDGFIRHMAEHGVTASRVHARNDKHAAFQFPGAPLPGVDYFDSHQVSIPTGWWLDDADRDRIVNAVKSWARVPVAA